MSEFLHMGGHAFYVWTAYGAAFVVLALNLAAPILRRRRLIARIGAGGPSAPPNPPRARGASSPSPAP